MSSAGSSSSMVFLKITKNRKSCPTFFPYLGKLYSGQVLRVFDESINLSVCNEKLGLISIIYPTTHCLQQRENVESYYMMVQQGLAGRGVWVATSQAKQDVEVRFSNPFPVASSSFPDSTFPDSPSASSSSVRKGFFPRGLLRISPFLVPESGLEYYMLNSLAYVFIAENIV